MLAKKVSQQEQEKVIQMKIFLPIKIRQTGGTSTFARNLQQELTARGHRVIFTYESAYDVLLASPRCPWPYLLDAKRKGKPIVQRLDGVYYPTTTAGWLYPLHNLPLAAIRHLVADYVVYQSAYSKSCCDQFLGKKCRERYTIIYNGVDITRFSPEGSQEKLRDNQRQHIFITVSRFRRNDQITPLLHVMKEYVERYEKNAKLIVVGNFTGAVRHIPHKFHNKASVSFIGIVPHHKLPSYLRAADVFLFSHLNPPCPNNVLEAMACGLPICGIADGAMPELVKTGHSGELLPVTRDTFYKPQRINLAAFAHNMHLIMQNRTHYVPNARQHALERFSLDTMIKNYLDVFSRLTKSRA